jgi:hypothetical protein
LVKIEEDTVPAEYTSVVTPVNTFSLPAWSTNLIENECRPSLNSTSDGDTQNQRKAWLGKHGYIKISHIKFHINL